MDVNTVGQELSLELIAQVIAEGIVSLAGDDFRMRSIFRRPDTLQRGADNAPDTSIQEFVNTIKAAANIGTHADGRGLTIGTQLPLDARQWPYVAVVWTGANEDVSTARAGEMINVQYLPHGSDPATLKMYVQETKGIDKRQTVLVSVFTRRPEEARFLHIALTHILHDDAWKLYQEGVVSMSQTEQGREPDMSDPTQPILPSITLSFLVRQTSQRLYGPVACRVSFDDTWFPT